MGNRTTTLSAYVDEEFAEEVREHADRNDVSVSKFIVETLERRIEQDEFRRVSQETQAEQRLEELAAQARDNVATATDDLEQAQRVGNKHAIALWELLKPAFGGAQRKEAMQTAQQRLAESDSSTQINNAWDGYGDRDQAEADDQEKSWAEKTLTPEQRKSLNRSYAERHSDRSADDDDADDDDSWSY